MRLSATENKVIRALEKASEVVTTTIQGVLVTVEIAPKQKGLIPAELPFCSALLTCPTVNVHMLRGSL
jgi:hypothetical protein